MTVTVSNIIKDAKANWLTLRKIYDWHV